MTVRAEGNDPLGIVRAFIGQLPDMVNLKVWRPIQSNERSRLAASILNSSQIFQETAKSTPKSDKSI